MSINLKIPDIRELKPRITVFGVGGAGGNAVNNMIVAGLQGVDFVVANTDAQALTMSKAERIIQMGVQVTEGLGAGSQPEVGRAAAEEVIDEIRDHLNGAHMVFVTAGMGGGTGTGAAPVIARIAKELGILTVGVVTKPFHFEGVRRMKFAEQGIAELQKCVDTQIIIPNQNLFRVANEKTTFADAFAMADQVLYSGVACITDLMVKEGLINLDFADVRAVMREMGKAMMGTGEASGEKRALRSAEAAISNPLIDDVSMRGARGLLISITGGKDLTLYEVDEAATRIREEVDQDANIIVGATFDDSLGENIRVAIVASGLVSSAPSQTGSGTGQGGSRPDPQLSRSFGQVPPQASAHSVPPPPPQPQPPQTGPAGPAQASAAPPLSPQSPFAPAQSPFALDGRVGVPQPPRQPEPQPPRAEPAAAREPYGAPRQEEPRELWRGPGNVVIEESRSPRQQHQQPGRQPAMPPSSPPPQGQAVPTDPFKPSPPEDLRRPAPRRVPDLEEFPAVGQRDYRAKSGQYESPRNQPDQRNLDRSASAEPPHRGGLLQRMMGGGRRGESTDDDDASHKRNDGGSRLPSFFNRNKG